MTEEVDYSKTEFASVEPKPEKSLLYMILGFRNEVVNCNDYGIVNERDNPCEFNCLAGAILTCLQITESEKGKIDSASYGLRNLFRVATVIVDEQWVSECTV